MTSFKPSYLPKTLPPYTILLGIGTSIFESGEDTNIQSITTYIMLCIYIYIYIYIHTHIHMGLQYIYTYIWASLVTQLIKNPPAMQEIPIQFLGQEDSLEKGQATQYSILGLPWRLRGKESACNVGDLDLIPVMGRYPGGGHGKPTQYSCLGNPHGQKSLVGCSPLGHKELDTTEHLSTAY